MAKKKKKQSIAKPVGIGLAALVAIGIAAPSDEEDVPDVPDKSVVETVMPEEQSKSPNDSEFKEVEKNIEIVVEPEKEPQAPVTSKSEQAEKEVAPETAPVPEADPEVAFRDKLLQYAYVGSSESDKYHKPTCRWTGNINDGNLVHFDSEDEAAASGYSPCGTCKP